ncbi:Crp/Fnr family transcriptional regulator [Arthrospiribacter ruber]|uniref:Crp/Fnr family transcriptional regulator n=1 Tax=Arthrospiribacter ruber TaxID=2487934 RepID=A0A951MCJ5_9BACT|nr:Crp/Fnr family transcriptional regulator [Arthrospiribacter ruber]MBW3466990.1 Crp/Fnr family transcriptional regulator [Arthrospiribacter ruber]
MEALINYLLQFGNLNKQQIDFITSKSRELALRKEDYFSEAGKIAKQVGFILDGILRVCYYSNKGEDITKYFIDENNFVVDLDSFENKIPSSRYVQAVTDCKLIVFPEYNWEEISYTIVGWESIVNKIIKKSLIQKLDRRSPLVSEDATTRYLGFIEKYPQLINRIPLSYLASYLGVTQSSLSRIRKNIR